TTGSHLSRKPGLRASAGLLRARHSAMWTQRSDGPAGSAPSGSRPTARIRDRVFPIRLRTESDPPIHPTKQVRLALLRRAFGRGPGCRRYHRARRHSLRSKSRLQDSLSTSWHSLAAFAVPDHRGRTGRRQSAHLSDSLLLPVARLDWAGPSSAFL